MRPAAGAKVFPFGTSSILELNVQPGMASQGAGPWSESYGKYLRGRNELLRAIRPADPPVPRSVPYAAARA